MASVLLALIYLAFVSLGLPDSLLGSAWPAIYTEWNLPISFMSYVSITISVMTITSSLLSDYLSRKIGSGLLTAVSILLTAIGLLGFSFANSYWLLFLCAVPYGLGAGGIDAALNNYIALHYKAKHMSWLHCMWGIGAFVSPNIMSYALTHNGWHQGYFIVFSIQAVICLLLFLSLPLWGKFEKNENKQTTENVPHLGVFGVLKLKGALLVFLAFFCYCAIEMTTFQWTATYFVLQHGIDEDLAATLASLFFLGMTVGRFISGFLSMKLRDLTLIRGGCAIIATGTILLFIPSNYILTVIAYIIIGIGCGPIYPSIMHNTPDLFGKKNSLSMIGVQMAFAYTSSVTIPPLLGNLIEKVGPEILPFSIVLFLVLLVVLYEATVMVRKKEQEKANHN